MILTPLAFAMVLALLAFAGLLLYLLEQLPIDAAIKKMMRGVVVVAAAVCVILWALSLFGYGPGVRFVW